MDGGHSKLAFEAASNSEQERLEISEEVDRQLEQENTLKSYNGFFEIAIEEDSRILEFDSAPLPKQPEN